MLRYHRVFCQCYTDLCLEYCRIWLLVQQWLKCITKIVLCYVTIEHFVNATQNWVWNIVEYGSDSVEYGCNSVEYGCNSVEYGC